MTEIVGIVPAAGYARRLQPLEGSKEMISVGGRPVIDHLVERMRIGGCTRIRVVTRAEKQDVISHAELLHAEVVLARPVTVSESIAAGLRELQPETIVLSGFPDTLWEPADAFRILVCAVANCDVALGLFRASADDLARSDVVVVDESERVLSVHVKPSQPPSEWVWGCFASRVEILAGLAVAEWPGRYFDELCRSGCDVRGLRLSNVWLDIGTREALDAAVDFGTRSRQQYASSDSSTVSPPAGHSPEQTPQVTRKREP